MQLVEIAHPDVEVTAHVPARAVEHHRRAGWRPVAEAPATDSQPVPAGSQGRSRRGRARAPKE